jgi:hypothetical protein
MTKADLFWLGMLGLSIAAVLTGIAMLCGDRC